jgi:hypothetical protein
MTAAVTPAQSRRSPRNPFLPKFRHLLFLLALWAAFWAALTAMLVLGATRPARAADPLDLAELGRRGLSQRSRDVIVTQALSPRARPPLEIGLVLDLAAYGGDDLAKAYLEMDAATNQMAVSPLPPESVRNLMAASMPAADIIALVESAAPSDGAEAAAVPGFAAAAAALTVTAGVNADRPIEAPAAPEPPAPATLAKAAADAAPAAAPEAPEAPLAPPAERPRANDLRRVPQVLSPGQPADPARPMPEAPGPYWTRTPRPDGFFMGVHDEVKADGHRYEVHANGRTAGMGQQVLSRASGHKVVRHHNGRTEGGRIEGPTAPAGPEFPERWGGGGDEVLGWY